MNKQNGNRTDKKGKHLNRADKLFLQNLYNNNVDVPTMTAAFNVHISTIYRELKKGEVTRWSTDLKQYKTYSADLSITLTEEQ